MMLKDSAVILASQKLGVGHMFRRSSACWCATVRYSRRSGRQFICQSHGFYCTLQVPGPGEVFITFVLHEDMGRLHILWLNHGVMDKKRDRFAAAKVIPKLRDSRRDAWCSGGFRQREEE